MSDASTGLDAGAAAVLGAAIGGTTTLLVGVIGPWVKERVERKSRSAETLIAAKRVAISAFVRALGNLLIAKESGSSIKVPGIEAAIAHTEVALLLNRDERPIESMCAATLNALLRPEGAMALGYLQSGLHKWFNGELSAEQARDRFTVLVEAAGNEQAAAEADDDA